MPTYQFTIKPFDQKSWPKNYQEELEVNNKDSAKSLARHFAVKHSADVRFNVKGSRKNHYYRLSEPMKNKLAEIKAKLQSKP